MLKKLFKPLIAVILILSMLLPLSSCVNSNDHWYVSLEKDVDMTAASKMIADAQAVTDAFPDIQYTYAFFIELDTPTGEHFELGTENFFAFTGRGTEGAAGYRKNTYTSLRGDTLTTEQVSEEHFLTEGSIYTERFGKKYRSKMNDKDFVSYTEYSDIAVNKSYLSESNFSELTVYNLFGSEKEIIFTGANEYIQSGIIAFTRLDETKYTYELDNVKLSVRIAEDGSIAEKHLTFTIDYYAASNPTSYLTYFGDFAYTVDKTEGVEVPDRDRSVAYSEIENVALLSSITSQGYKRLIEIGSLDATYSKYIKVTDQTKEYVFDADARITAAYVDGKLSYGSIDTEYYSKESKKHNTTGIFQTPNGYSYRYYDYVTDTRSNDIDQAEAKYTDVQLYDLIAATLSTEQIFEDEISSISVLSETDSEITFNVRFNTLSAKLYAAYLVDTFSASQNTADLNNQALSIEKCNIEITVRKSDGCIMRQLIDFKGEITGLGNLSGIITVEGLFEMKVNSTEPNVTILTPEAFESEVNAQKNN